MQPYPDGDDFELLALADATDQVAAGIDDAAIEARLRVIADEMRAMARHSGRSFGELEMLQTWFVPT